MTIRNRLTLSLAALVALAVPIPLLAQAEFTGAGQTLELDCQGGEAVITGAGNETSISGECSSLSVTGASNIITISLAAGATIHVEGASNDIAWIAPGNSRPRIHSVGADNRIYRMQ